MKIFKKFSVVIFFILCCNAVFGQVNLVKYLPKGYVRDGSKDYTAFLQKGINENKNIIMPNFPILVNKSGLKLKSDQSITFQQQSLLRMKPNAETNYGVLNIIGVSNIKILNPNLIGDREAHLSTKGEWGMGINILSSRNVSINNPKISKMWGDGIYIGEISYKERSKYKLNNYYSKDIEIIGGVINNNRRNGISVISVKGLNISKTIISNTSGTLPMAGIDIEPNDNGNFLENIVIQDVITQNNTEVGIKYVPANFFGVRQKNVTIIIENFHDIGAKNGLIIGGATGKYSGVKQEGKIVIKRFKSESNIMPVATGSIQKYSPKIEIHDMTIYKKKDRDSNLENETKKKLSSKGMAIF